MVQPTTARSVSQPGGSPLVGRQGHLRMRRHAATLSTRLRIICAAGDRQQAKISAAVNQETVRQALQDAGFRIGSPNYTDLQPNIPELIYPQTGSYSWDNWQQLISSVDESEARIGELCSALSIAVMTERYSEAARLKTELTQLEQQYDTVMAAQQELQAAITEERYADAAAMRDTTAVGLAGWWTGGADGDPCGHLLHITQTFGRFVARAYTAGSLAEMQGWTEANPLRQNADLLADIPDNLGQPVLELYLQKNSRDQWEQQAVVLQPSHPALTDAVGYDPMKDSYQEDLMPSRVSSSSLLPQQEKPSTTRVPATLVPVHRNQFVLVPSNSGTGGVKQTETVDSMAIKIVTSADGEVPEDGYVPEPISDKDDEQLWDAVADAVADLQGRVSVSGLGEEEASGRDIASSIKESLSQLAEEGVSSAEFDLAPMHEMDTIDQAVCGPSTYTRLETDYARTDPLQGLYLGAFGGHGAEVIKLRRSVWEDGSPSVEGIKVTGDLNVPAGHTSFRARVGKQFKLADVSMYPEELGVTARYLGEGCVAQPGFKDAKFVQGELLMFSKSAHESQEGSVTGGAELGFVWDMPGKGKYLILMNRVDLNDLVDRSQL